MLFAAGGDTTTCLVELPVSLRGQEFTWGPTGGKVLFADGSVFDADGVRRDALLPSPGASLGWTRPTGTSTIHVGLDGTLVKVSNDGTTAATLTPLASHEAVIYHPDGTTFATSGAMEFDQGIWISKNDGTDPQPLAFTDLGVRIPEMIFTNDARWLVFVADHTADDFDDGYHLHSIFVEPFELEDGTLSLGSGSEFGATTHIVSNVSMDTIVVPPLGSGFGTEPDGLAVAQGVCGPDRRAVYLPDLSVHDDGIVLLDAPGFPVGFISSTSGEQRIVVATSEDGCTGPFDWHEVIVDTVALSTTVGVSGTGVDALALRSVAPTVDITLSGVVIEPFA